MGRGCGMVIVLLGMLFAFLSRSPEFKIADICVERQCVMKIAYAGYCNTAQS